MHPVFGFTKERFAIMFRFWFMLKKITSLLPWVLVLGLALYAFFTYRVPPKLKPDQWELTKLEGTAVDASTWEGQPLVINFWATWCGTCLEEMPKLNEAAEVLLEEGFRIICISDEEPAKIQAFQDKRNYPFTFLHSTLPLSEYNVHSYPTTYIVSADGEVVIQRAGSILPFDDSRFVDKILNQTLGK